jgi:hypothetical protein
MDVLVGVTLALFISLGAAAVGLDRDRAFYPMLTIVIASYYVLFAIMGGSRDALVRESAICAGFALVAILGFKRNLWLLVAALLGHGLLDAVHGHVVNNPGVPAWWPMFCLAYDATASAFLAWLLVTSRLRPRA